ncbi:SIR2 family protein [Vibrio sp. SCSIO 43136]|uniref:SIR2 family NAD-dependent protein deacylase n=1 Tax=Vibrio sp. SCSIO 43136 TaxID=2819101 RepID=UPI002075E8FA|nr:SIR2 family protein [Vibrio sp. SCSIO 43136]USD67720.1 SIR2 family protein [Vibrio sp. SCSIO 43136]
MSISLESVVDSIEPSKTVLFFGAGSSIPSGAPSVSGLISEIGRKFNLDTDGYSLTELSSLAEDKTSRKELISFLRPMFERQRVTGAMLNLPLYKWKNIYTTNYDTFIEQAYSKKEIPLPVLSTNYDFAEQTHPEVTKLYKLHGTIDKDISDGHQSRIIISETDYDHTSDYRDALWDAFKFDMSSSSLVIIGYSLSDSHIKDLVNRAIKINNQSHSPATIYLILYTKDENRASLLEKRGVKVAFGSVDDFFSQLHKFNEPEKVLYTSSGNPFDRYPLLQAITYTVKDQLRNTDKNVSAMFHGWPATYSDIKAGLTFERPISRRIKDALNLTDVLMCTILGPSGMGKSTLARQVLLSYHNKGLHCWEHKSSHQFLPHEWRGVARLLESNNQKGVVLVDDAHIHLNEINTLADLLSADGNNSLKVILTSTRNKWYPRIKSPTVFNKGEEFVVRKLCEVEIENLLNLVESHPELQPLVANTFAGFSKSERKRRLTAKCESDTFVCLKNIFASEQFDDIVLREFADLEPELREIYRLVSAMESAGVNVHRQLVIRLLGIPAQSVAASISNLVDIIHEYTISDREGIYGWKGRHPVITDIISKYKMQDETEYYQLFERVIDSIIPTYDVEIRTIKQLCDFDSGISRFPDKQKRNKLLRKMISKAPGERIPRHRLIRYLIDINELEKAETEIRLYENDFKQDSAMFRYQALLLMARSERTKGILDEDRVSILEMARIKVAKGIEKFKNNKHLLKTYCDVGLELFKRTGNAESFDEALVHLKLAEERLGDPEITTSIIVLEQQFSRIQLDAQEKVEEA